MPERGWIVVQGGAGSGSARGRGRGRPNVSVNEDGSAEGSGRAGGVVHEHKDQKRVLLGMRAREGGGGDGTVVYYFMQEGEVKPRQNG